MTRAERKRLFDAMQVETNPQRKLAYKVALDWVPFDVVLPHSPKLSRYVADIFATMGSDVNNRDLMLLNAWRAAQDATLKMNKRGRGVELSELIAGPTFGAVKRELKRLYPNRNISRMVDELTEVVRNSDQYQKAEATGRLIKIPAGDGMALVFYTSPGAPAQCAVEISRLLKAHPRLQLRMGVHSGPVSGVIDVNGHANFAGAGLNIAQRVMACGDAGHILVSKHVAEHRNTGIRACVPRYVPLT